MKIALFSDLHNEFRQGTLGFRSIDAFKRKVIDSDADLVINAGDLHPDPVMRTYFEMGIGKPYLAVLGNHDFYGGKLYPYRAVQTHGNLKVVGCTLWTDFDQNDMLTKHNFGKVMMDEKAIMPITDNLVEDMYQIFQEDLKFIENENPDIVVTHHGPSYKSVHPKYHRYGFSNYYFVSNLDQFIKNNSNIKLWCHGHTHLPFDYDLYQCRVVCNPLGYPGETYQRDSLYQLKEINIG